MGIERERRFLVASDDWRAHSTGERIRQGYLSTARAPTVRVRVRGAQAFLTIKGETHGTTRSEFEYAIPLADAEEMLSSLCAGGIVDKTRHVVDHNGHAWEVDDFAGANAGLVLAEIELDTDEALEQAVRDAPPWIGREVTGEGRLANASLATNPISSWSDEERAAVIPRLERR